MTPYYCKHCNKVIWCFSDKQWCVSYCLKTDKAARVWKMPNWWIEKYYGDIED